MNDEQVNLEEIKRILVDGDFKQIRTLIRDVHQADIADALEELNHDQRMTFFKKVKPELVSDIFEEIEPPIQLEVIQDILPLQATKFIDSMDLDDAADLLHELQEEDEEMAERLIRSLTDHKELQKLLTYDEHVAGGIMNPDYIAIPENLTVKQAVALFRKTNPPGHDFSYYIYIIDDDNHLKGITNLRDLIMAKSVQKVKELRNENYIAVNVQTDQEEVARIMAKYDLLAVPVIDDFNTMVGIITIDDIIDVIEEEATEDFFRLTGAMGEFDEDIMTGSVYQAARHRLTWLLLTLIGGLLSGTLLSIFAIYFHNIHLSLPIILSFVPLLIGIGGNIGNQSATIMVRGLATGAIRKSSIGKNILREMGVSLLIGLTLGSVLFLGSYAFHHKLEYGLIIGIAVIINILLSAAFGTLLPVFLTKIKVDPAIASAPFISSSIDVAGMVIYFLVIKAFLAFFPF